MNIKPLILSTAALAATASAAHAKTTIPDINQVKAELESAICTQDWGKAIEKISVLMAMPSITSEHRQELVDWRHRFSNYEAQGKRFDSLPNCRQVSAPRPVQSFEDNRARADFNWQQETARISQRQGTPQPRFSRVPSHVTLAGNRWTPAVSAPQSPKETTPDINQVKSDLRLAICMQDWGKAMEQASVLMAMPGITPEHRQALVSWRHQFGTYASASTQFDNLPGCEGVSVPVEVKAVENNQPRADFNWQAEAAKISSGQPSQPAAQPTVTTEATPVVVATRPTTTAAGELMVSGVYSRGNVVYGTIQNESNQVLTDVQIAASIYDNDAGGFYSARYTHNGVIAPGSQIEVPIVVESAATQAAAGHNLVSPSYYIVSSTPVN